MRSHDAFSCVGVVGCVWEGGGRKREGGEEQLNCESTSRWGREGEAEVQASESSGEEGIEGNGEREDRVATSSSSLSTEDWSFGA